MTTTLTPADIEEPNIFNQILALEKEMNNAGLDLIVKRGIITKIDIGESPLSDSFFLRYPYLLR